MSATENTAPRFAVLNLANDRLLRDVNGQVVTWPTQDAAFDRAFDLVRDFDVVRVTTEQVRELAR